MTALSWMIALSLATMGAGRPTAHWLGQDGRDLVSPSITLEPNGYQDVHIRLLGLHPQRAIEKVDVYPFGGGFWSSEVSPRSWRIAVERRPGSSTADLYFEPGEAEKGRVIDIKVTYRGGMTTDLAVRGGRTNPNLRAPGTGPAVIWAGQTGQDLTTAEPGVGPDNFQDVSLSLSRLASSDVIRTAILDAGGGIRWQAGLNSELDRNAEVIRDTKDPSTAQFLFQPDRDLAGRPLILTLQYANGKSDVLRLTAGASDPRRAMPPLTVPTLTVSNTISGRWLGQDGAQGNPGDVHVELSGLPSDRAIAAVLLSDSVAGLWVYRSSEKVKLDIGPWERPLVFRKGADSTRADLFLTPYRDESDASLTLRLVFEEGEDTIARFKAGACDPFAGLPQPAATSVVAKPGDDLNDLAGRFGTVTLASGVHRLSKPLTLEKPVTIAGERGAILEFAQGAGEPPWTTAIKIHSGSTTLRDFTIRFAGRVRWNQQVSYGPAVIGTTDNLEPARSDPKFGLTFQGLDITTSPSSGTKDWEEAVRVMRLVTSQGGSISGCALEGGPIEFFGGPWRFVDNTHRGTPPGTFSHGVVACHFVHDVLVRGNRIKPHANSGKLWRFFVVTDLGHAVHVENNTVEEVGPRDNDKIPSHNAPEIILSEAYKLCFEGRPAALSADGRLVSIRASLGQQPHVGHLVSVLTGPQAGQWRRIAQQVSATTFLLDTPLPPETTLISISAGLVDTRVEGNTINCRGGRAASPVVLPGNQFGTLVRNNRLFGGSQSIRLVAAASEGPLSWGWSRGPCFGALVENNLIEDSFQGGILGVEHSPNTKATTARVYMTVTVKDNTIRWSDRFLRQQARTKDSGPLRGLTYGFAGGHNPGETLVAQQGCQLDAPASARSHPGVFVISANVNGQTFQNRGFRLPAFDPATNGARPASR